MTKEMAQKAVKRKKNSLAAQTEKSYAKHAFAAGNRIHRNYTWLAGVVVVVLLVIICVSVSGASKKIESRNESYDKQIEMLNAQIEEQEKRREELDLYSVYITTKQFIEEFAREKLGLVFKDELIFRPNEE